MHKQKRRTTEELHPFLNVEGNIVTRDKEKAEVYLLPSLPSSFAARPVVPQGLSPLSWEIGTGSRTKPS